MNDLLSVNGVETYYNTIGNYVFYVLRIRYYSVLAISTRSILRIHRNSRYTHYENFPPLPTKNNPYILMCHSNFENFIRLPPVWFSKFSYGVGGTKKRKCLYKTNIQKVDNLLNNMIIAIWETNPEKLCYFNQK